MTREEDYNDSTEAIEKALSMVKNERTRQCELWGNQSGISLYEWMSIIGEEYGELCQAVNETCFKNPKHPEKGGRENIIKEASQVAAVAIALIENMPKQAESEDSKEW